MMQLIGCYSEEALRDRIAAQSEIGDLVVVLENSDIGHRLYYVYETIEDEVVFAEITEIRCRFLEELNLYNKTQKTLESLRKCTNPKCFESSYQIIQKTSCHKNDFEDNSGCDCYENIVGKELRISK